MKVKEKKKYEVKDECCDNLKQAVDVGCINIDAKHGGSNSGNYCDVVTTYTLSIENDNDVWMQITFCPFCGHKIEMEE